MSEMNIREMGNAYVVLYFGKRYGDLCGDDMGCGVYGENEGTDGYGVCRYALGKERNVEREGEKVNEESGYEEVQEKACGITAIEGENMRNGGCAFDV